MGISRRVETAIAAPGDWLRRRDLWAGQLGAQVELTNRQHRITPAVSAGDDDGAYQPVAGVDARQRPAPRSGRGGGAERRPRGLRRWLSVGLPSASTGDRSSAPALAALAHHRSRRGRGEHARGDRLKLADWHAELDVDPDRPERRDRDHPQSPLCETLKCGAPPTSRGLPDGSATNCSAPGGQRSHRASTMRSAARETMCWRRTAGVARSARRRSLAASSCAARSTSSSS